MDGDGRPGITFSIQFVILFAHSSIVIPDDSTGGDLPVLEELDTDPWPLAS
ncbi:hypothetical protein HGRIS_001410 [Hohenbuehelia grisea]